MVIINTDRLMVQTAHDARHFHCGLGRLPAPVMLFVQATFAGLLVAFKQENLVNDGHFVLDLDQGQCVADRFANMLGVGGRAAEDNAEAEDGGKLAVSRGLAGQPRGDHRDFVSTGDADDLKFAAGAADFSFRSTQHGIHVERVIVGGDDGKITASCAAAFGLNFLEHI
jgi:hypothetical protein